MMLTSVAIVSLSQFFLSPSQLLQVNVQKVHMYIICSGAVCIMILLLNFNSMYLHDF